MPQSSLPDTDAIPPGTFVVADPSLTIRRIVARTLTGLHVPQEQIVFLSTATELTRVVEGDLPAFLITEWDLPGGDGLTAISQMRARAGGQDVPALLITSRSLVADMERARDVGVSDVVLRPFTPHVLREKIGQLLGQPVF